MATAVVLFLSDEGQMSVGEVDPSTIDTQDLQPSESFEEAVEIAQKLTLGEEPPPEVEENAFNKSVNMPVKNQMMEDED